MRLNRLTVFCLCVTLLAIAAPTFAQDFRGRINGTVTDNTGAVLPGVTVTATSPALIQPQVQVTGARGDYRFIALPPGVYDIDVRAGRVPGVEARRHARRHQPDADGRSAAAGRDAAGDGHRHRRIADRRHVDDAGRHELHQGTADRNPERPRHLGGDGAGARPPDDVVTTSAARAPARRPATCPTASATRARPSSKASTRPKATSANAGYFDFGSFEEFQVGGAGSGADSFGGGANLSITVKSGGDRFSGNWYSDYSARTRSATTCPTRSAPRTARRGRLLQQHGAQRAATRSTSSTTSTSTSAARSGSTRRGSSTAIA